MKSKSAKKSATKTEDTAVVTKATKVVKVKTPKAAKPAKVKSEKGRGRPIVEGSPRQIRLAATASRAAENGGVVKRGRAVDKTSARQVRLAKAAEMKAAGITVKRGRPAVAKVEKPAKVKKVK